MCYPTSDHAAPSTTSDAAERTHAQGTLDDRLAAGQTILTHNHGNQLPVKLTITTAGTTATAQIAFASFG